MQSRRPHHQVQVSETCTRNQAQALREANIGSDITSVEEFKRFFTPLTPDRPEIHGGLVRAKWSNVPESVALLDPL